MIKLKLQQKVRRLKIKYTNLKRRTKKWFEKKLFELVIWGLTKLNDYLKNKNG